MHRYQPQTDRCRKLTLSLVSLDANVGGIHVLQLPITVSAVATAGNDCISGLTPFNGNHCLPQQRCVSPGEPLHIVLVAGSTHAISMEQQMIVLAPAVQCVGLLRGRIWMQRVQQTGVQLPGWGGQQRADLWTLRARLL